MKTRIAIIAPNNTCQLIKEYISKLHQFEVGYCNENSISAFIDLSHQNFDLLLIDTNSTPLNGFELLDSFTQKPKVIMVSKDDKHAAKAFDYEVLDYLIYPFSFCRFLKSVHRFASMVACNEPERTAITANPTSKLQIQANKTLYTIPEEEIYYIESMGDYVKVHTKEKHHLFKHSLQKLELQLNTEKFLRIHRSYIVATQKIESMSSKFISLNNKSLPIGRTYQKQAKEKLLQQFSLIKS